MFRLLIVLFVYFISSSVVWGTEKRVALIVGNSNYEHAPDLRNPLNDATRIADQLERLGFFVVRAFDVNKKAMDQSLKEFAEKLSGADAGLFFFAGHGLQFSGKNYLLPVDAKLITAVALDFEAIKLDFIQRIMEQQTSTNIIFLDACRNNPLTRNLASAMGARSINIGTGLAPAESGFGTLISFSTQPGNVALDGDGKHSPFADALIKELDSPTQDLTGMLIAVRNSVMVSTNNRQVPWEHSALRAKFYFQQTRNLTPKEALKICTKDELHPRADEIAHRLTNKLRNSDSEYGWFGGAANKGNENRKIAFPVSNVSANRGNIVIRYGWKNGELTLVPVAPFYGSRSVGGLRLQGTWIQDNGYGCIELNINENNDAMQSERAFHAKGLWSERVGNPLDHASFLRIRP